MMTLIMKNKTININFLGDFISIFKHENFFFYLQNYNTIYIVYDKYNRYSYYLNQYEYIKNSLT